MGYRSHVLFEVSVSTDVTLRLTTPDVIEILDCADRTYTRTPSGEPEYVIYEWDAAKWYASWPAVQALETWMSITEDAYDDEPPFSFLRDGESLEDVEHRGSWDSYLRHGIWIEEPKIEPRDAAIIVAMCDGEWGEYMDEGFKKALDSLRLIANQFKPKLRNPVLESGDRNLET